MRLFFIGLFFFLIELYAFQAIKVLIKEKTILWCYAFLSFIVIIYLLYSFYNFDRSVGQTHQTMMVMAVTLIFIVPKIIIIIFMLGEDILRFFITIYNYFTNTTSIADAIPSRRKFVSRIALGLAAIPFASLIYGVLEGRYNFKVIKQTIFFPDLPDAFDGFTITQISDIHSGSFDNPEKINYAIDLVNQQNSDMILFTGDIVNTHATEMHPWLKTFKRIKDHDYGKFSVLGNHDYGEYVSWPSAKAKQENFSAIKNLYGDINFKLLLNENIKIKKGTDTIALVGVENWGKNFKQAGDLAKASAGLTREDFKILMSHDPSHWEYEVKDHPKHFHLTLSGHTHGMQFGIEIPGFFKWSPVQYVYKQWAGLYEKMGRFVYVNRGFGFHAYPGRVGIWPEITVIQLKKGKMIT